MAQVINSIVAALYGMVSIRCFYLVVETKLQRKPMLQFLGQIIYVLFVCFLLPFPFSSQGLNSNVIIDKVDKLNFFLIILFTPPTMDRLLSFCKFFKS